MSMSFDGELQSRIQIKSDRKERIDSNLRSQHKKEFQETLKLSSPAKEDGLSLQINQKENLSLAKTKKKLFKKESGAILL